MIRGQIVNFQAEERENQRAYRNGTYFVGDQAIDRNGDRCTLVSMTTVDEIPWFIEYTKNGKGGGICQCYADSWFAWRQRWLEENKVKEKVDVEVQV